ncbi:MAG: sugar transferase [Lachnospiraceae bacterium]|nr:sugar transferase [Lachnospiraceae bacterium]
MIKKGIQFSIKRIFDITISLLVLTISLPIMLFALLGIVFTMPGPIFFTQERVGKNKKNFRIYKLRTMKVDKDAEKKLDGSKDAERLTKFGKILRRTKIDELPQLINVLIGDMSLVGPRPTIYQQVMNYNEMQAHRLDMRPGMTGLAQVNGNIYLSWDERIKFDLEYINHFSLMLDLKILAKTVLVVVFGEKKFKGDQS